MTTVPEPSAELLQRAAAVRLAAVDLGQTDDGQRAAALQAMADALDERAAASGRPQLDYLSRRFQAQIDSHQAAIMALVGEVRRSAPAPRPAPQPPAHALPSPASRRRRLCRLSLSAPPLEMT